MEVNFMTWIQAWEQSQTMSYYWLVYQIVFVLAVAAFVKTNNQD